MERTPYPFLCDPAENLLCVRRTGKLPGCSWTTVPIRSGEMGTMGAAIHDAVGCPFLEAKEPPSCSVCSSRGGSFVLPFVPFWGSLLGLQHPSPPAGKPWRLALRKSDLSRFWPPPTNLVGTGLGRVLPRGLFLEDLVSRRVTGPLPSSPVPYQPRGPSGEEVQPDGRPVREFISCVLICGFQAGGSG